MEALFQAVNVICGKIQIVSNLFWDFPTNFDWYANIPILGNFSLAIILLVGTGIYFTFRLRFIQVRKFRHGLHVLMRQKSSGTGISSLASFLLSTAMRVGPGNILGVTGAISTGGPGALLWMWISAVGAIAGVFTGTVIETNSALYWISFAVLIAATAVISFGGIKKVTKVTDLLVPVMAVIYILTVILLIVFNIPRIPWFFGAVFSEAFRPEAVFGGAFGIALSQGIKRGLMSNEAGQGTITMPAAAADAKHPCDQGCVQALGVFLDTIVICTLTGFVVVMGRVWLTEDSAAWFELGKLDRFLASCGALTGNGTIYHLVTMLVSVCFGLFAFTCLVGFMSFTEMCANRISTRPAFINTIRVLCLVVISFGVITNIAGMDLSALWDLSDFANILMVYCNLPLQYIGFKYVLRAWEHFEKNDGTAFTSKIAGIDVTVWDERAKMK